MHGRGGKEPQLPRLPDPGECPQDTRWGSREMAGNTNSKQDSQIKWAFKNSSFSQTFQNRLSLIRVMF